MKKWVQAVGSVVLLGAMAVAAGAPRDGGKAALKAGRMDEAIALLRAATRQQAGDAESWHLLSRAYLSLERWNDAVKAAEQAVKLEPNNSDYHLWLGRAYGYKAEHAPFWQAWGLGKKVRQEFETAVRLNAGNVDAMSDLAEFYIEAPAVLGGGKDKAQQQAERIATYDAATAHWVRGRLAEKSGDLALAEKEYKQAVEVSQGQAGSWLDLASFYRRSKQPAKMEDAVNRAVAADKKKPAAFYDAATVLVRAGRNFPAAAQLLKRYLAGPQSEEAPAFKAHYLLGVILERQGDRKGAAEEYEAALALARDYSDAQQALRRVRSAQ